MNSNLSGRHAVREGALTGPAVSAVGRPARGRSTNSPCTTGWSSPLSTCVATSLASVRLGIVPFGFRLPVTPLHGFWLFDDRVIMVETFAAEMRLTQPEELRLYRGVFDRLATMARYGADARRLLTDALDALVEQSPDEFEK
ncbi:Scr1 family TA system antitoxin-like transcriptional regulator [Streptomyces sp. NPDC006283]|uniref:Scr1 family TA system antitoxin-like transcriptional regulator n=1 Tax=Streptomyces sp. NPDC006283 TaxID=3156741 RepID=UPI0033B428A9